VTCDYWAVSATTSVAIRPGRPDDAEACGRICYEAFRAIAERHGFPPDFPSPEVASGLLAALLAHPGFYGVVAERDGSIVGSNFLDERSHIAGLGPITVDPAVQDSQVGRQLMLALLARARDVGFPGVRLLQAAYHMRSLSLYAKLGFDVREACATLQGPPVQAAVPGCSVRPARAGDLEACNRVCVAVHGHDRSGELAEAIGRGAARVVERGAEITGYTTGVAFFAHSVGRTNEDLQALIGAVDAYDGPGFLLPLRNADLFRWCLDQGLRVVQVMTLMTLGFYREPQGAYLPSILY
jgi:predicted N-acetyltransferase YhbS